MLSNILDRISFTSLFLVVVLLPVFFLPFTLVPVGIAKGLLVVVGLAVSVIFWAVARFSDGNVSFPRSTIILAGLGVVAVSLISALLSSNPAFSLFGILFDVGTFWFMFAAFLLMFICSVMIKDNKSAQMLLFGVILSTVAVLVFQIFRFMFPAQLSLGILGANTDNLVGTFNALGLFAGFACLASLFVVEFFSVPRVAKIIFGVLMLICLFVIASVNFVLVWELLGIFSLFIFVYKISFSSDHKGEDLKVNFPGFSFAVVMVSLLFFMSGQFIGSVLPERLKISNSEVSPSFTATMKVTKDAVKSEPIVGAGPNRFAELWALYKPASINGSPFWNTSFNTGSGLIPTFAANTGVLGILSWLVFFGFFLVSGARSLFSGIKQGAYRETAAFFVLALYLFVASFFYSAGSLILLLAFAFTGVFIGLLSNKAKGQVTVSFLDDHRKSFFFILSLVLIMVLSAAITFKYIERFASVPYFARAVQAQTVEVSEASIGKALSLHQNDLYLRTYAQVYFAKMNTLLNKGEALTEAEKAELQASFSSALSGAGAAVAYNPKNYLNHQTLGDVYRAAGDLGVKDNDPYLKAVESYQAAALLNPLNPGIELSIARAYLANKNTKDGKEFALKALALKPDYIDALLVLSQIAKNEGNSSQAISYAEQALALAPTNQDLIKYVNSLKGAQ